MNFLKHLLFSQVTPLIRLAKTKDIQESDLPALPSHLDPRTVDVPFENIKWTTTRTFLFSILGVMGRFIKPGYTWYFFSSVMSLASPVLVNQFVGLISAGINQQNLPLALTYGFLLGFTGFLAGLFLQHYFVNTLQSYQVVTNIINTRLFAHSLKLSQAARQKSQIGDIVNHMSSDCDSIAEFPSTVGEIAMSIFMIVAVVSMLFYYIGVSALAALAVLFSLAPLTSYVAKKFTQLDTEMMAFRDHRVTLMNQVLNAIRVVKYFAWEKSVSKEVTEIREKELQSRRRMARAEVISSLGYLAVSTLVLFVALGTHVLRGQELSAALIFTCISLFALLEGPFGEMSKLISRTSSAVVGAQRILSFLQQEKVQILGGEALDAKAPVGVQLQSVSVTYPGSKQEVLKGVDLQVAPGASVAIVGPVGAGKSTLLATLLAEVLPSSGQVLYPSLLPSERPHLAYVPQEAYIVNSTLLENMHFGEEVTKEDLRRALHASCLSRDLKEWSGGLRTEIGEKGVNLSGGQKQRVSLARAYLRRPQVVLLDDPLSAVDAETEKLLCERLLFGAWKEITRVVVTHRLEYLPAFDQVVFLQNGQIQGAGTFAQLLQTCPPFAEFYEEHSKSQGEDHAKVALDTNVSVDTAAETDFDEKKSRVTEDEDREVGAVKSSVYWDYISSLGGRLKKNKAAFKQSHQVSAPG